MRNQAGRTLQVAYHRVQHVLARSGPAGIRLTLPWLADSLARLPDAAQFRVVNNLPLLAGHNGIRTVVTLDDDLAEVVDFVRRRPSPADKAQALLRNRFVQRFQYLDCQAAQTLPTVPPAG